MKFFFLGFSSVRVYSPPYFRLICSPYLPYHRWFPLWSEHNHDKVIFHDRHVVCVAAPPPPTPFAVILLSFSRSFGFASIQPICPKRDPFRFSSFIRSPIRFSQFCFDSESVVFYFRFVIMQLLRIFMRLLSGFPPQLILCTAKLKNPKPHTLCTAKRATHEAVCNLPVWLFALLLLRFVRCAVSRSSLASLRFAKLNSNGSYAPLIHFIYCCEI